MELPIHPQWFTRKEKTLFRLLESIPENQTVLDIGCADKWITHYLPKSTKYIGLDYPPTADALYESNPTLYGNAESLPLSSSCLDYIIAFDVLEHIKRPQAALLEIERTLKAKGKVLIRIPFLYPIHDAPHDYTRLTEFGLKNLFSTTKLKILNFSPIGSPIETSALLSNIAISISALKLLKNKNPLGLAACLLPIYFFLNNIMAFLISRITPDDSTMPHTYFVVLQKT